jgi:L-rhamnose mutarotase
MSSNKKKKWGVDVKKIIEDMDEEEEKIWSCLEQVFEG